MKQTMYFIIFMLIYQVSFGQAINDTLISKTRSTDKWFENYKQERDSLQQVMNDSINANPNNGKYRFWISSIDKAGSERITYEVRESRIIIKKGPYDFIYFAPNYYADKITYDTTIDVENQRKLMSLMQSIKTNSIKSTYNNGCIIDGLILHFHFEWNDKVKSFTVSNYYLEEVVPFIDFINSIVPQKFSICYDKKWLLEMQKDCDYILD